MSDRTDAIQRDEQAMGAGIKSKFQGLDAYVPPAPPFERIEGVARSPRASTHGRAVRFRGGAGFSLAFAGIAAVLVLVLGSGMFGPRPGTAPAGGSSAATPQQTWSRIENVWMPKRETAREQITAATSDFGAQVVAYKAFRDATRGWMANLSAVPADGWRDRQKTDEENTRVGTEMAAFIQAGTDEANLLDQAAAAKLPADITALASQITSAEASFNTSYAVVRYDIMGGSDVATATPTPTPTSRPSSGCSIPPTRSAVACASSAATSGATNPVATGSGASPASARMRPGHRAALESRSPPATAQRHR